MTKPTVMIKSVILLMTETIALSRFFLRIRTTRKLRKLLEKRHLRPPVSLSTRALFGSSLVSETARVLGGNKQSSKLDDKSTGPADYKIKFEIRGAVGSEAVNREWLSVATRAALSAETQAPRD